MDKKFPLAQNFQYPYILSQPSKKLLLPLGLIDIFSGGNIAFILHCQLVKVCFYSQEILIQRNIYLFTFKTQS
jgi:hypothetical protein